MQPNTLRPRQLQARTFFALEDDPSRTAAAAPPSHALTPRSRYIAVTVASAAAAAVARFSQSIHVIKQFKWQTLKMPTSTGKFALLSSTRSGVGDQGVMHACRHV